MSSLRGSFRAGHIPILPVRPGSLLAPLGPLLLDRGCFNLAQSCLESKPAAGRRNCTQPSVVFTLTAHGRCFPEVFPLPEAQGIARSCAPGKGKNGAGKVLNTPAVNPDPHWHSGAAHTEPEEKPEAAASSGAGGGKH